MAKTQTTVGQTTKTVGSFEKRIPLKLKVGLESFLDEKVNQQREYVAAALVDPFPEYAEDFNNVRIAPRWDKDASLFKFRMKRFLRTSDDVVLTGYCEPVGFASKKPEDAGKMVYYPGIFFKVPYSGEPVEFGFKKRKETDKDGHVTFSDSGDSYIFRDLVAELWGGSYEPSAIGSDIDTAQSDAE